MDQYSTWKVNIKNLLMVAGGSALDVYLGKIPKPLAADENFNPIDLVAWTQCDNRGNAVQILSLHSSLTAIIDSLNTSQTADGCRLAIEKRFRPSDAMGVQRVKMELNRMTFGTNSSVEALELFKYEFNSRLDFLTLYNQPQSEFDSVIHILGLVSPSLRELISYDNTGPNAGYPSLENLFIRLIDNANLRETSVLAHAAFAHPSHPHPTNNPSSVANTPELPRDPCYICGQPHWTKDCKDDRAPEWRKVSAEKKAAKRKAQAKGRKSAAVAVAPEIDLVKPIGAVAVLPSLGDLVGGMGDVNIGRSSGWVALVDSDFLDTITFTNSSSENLVDMSSLESVLDSNTVATSRDATTEDSLNSLEHVKSNLATPSEDLRPSSRTDDDIENDRLDRLYGQMISDIESERETALYRSAHERDEDDTLGDETPWGDARRHERRQHDLSAFGESTETLPDTNSSDLPSAQAPSFAATVDDDSATAFDPVCFLSTTAPPLRSTTGVYILDTGANSHMTGSRDDLNNFRACRPQPISGIGESQLFCTGVGSVLFRCDIRGQDPHYIVVHPVLFVQGIAQNILSGSLIDKRGFELRIKNGTISVFADVGGSPELRATATRSSLGLYDFNGTVISHSNGNWTDKFNSIVDHHSAATPRASSFLATTTSRASLTTWHKRLCHLHNRSLKILQSSDQVHGLVVSDKTLCSCNSCLVGKARRLPFPRSRNRATEKLGLVHADLITFNVGSLSGCRYGLLLIDDYSRMGWFYPLGRKSDTYGAFKIWVARVELESSCKLKIFRTDNGGEFLSKDFKDLLHSKGTIHQLSQPYTSTHNTRAERPLLSLANGIITMLTDSGAPQELWAEAALTFTYTKNKTPHRGIDNAVPEAVWKGAPVNVSQLRAFGCQAWMTLLDAQTGRKKLDAKGLSCIFVGYQPDVKAWRVYDPVSKKVTYSQDVVFDETAFPLNLNRLPLGGVQSSLDTPPLVRPGAIPEFVESDDLLTQSNEPVYQVLPNVVPTPVSPNKFALLDPGPNPDDSDDESDDSLEYDSDSSGPSIAPVELRRSERLASSTPSHPQLPPPAATIDTPPTVYECEDSPDPLNILPDVIRSFASLAGPHDDAPIFSLPSADPLSYAQAMKSPEAQFWVDGILKERSSLEKLEVWDVIDSANVPSTHRPIGSKCVFRTKRDKDGKITSYKVRIVAQGFPNARESILTRRSHQSPPSLPSASYSRWPPSSAISSTKPMSTQPTSKPPSTPPKSFTYARPRASAISPNFRTNVSN